MSMVPDLTDEHFAANASGVAMRYKLLGLEQLTRNKERWFRQALRERMARFVAFFARLGAPELDAGAVKITFTRALPVNDSEIAAMVAQLHGILPDKALFSQVPFVENVDEAMQQMREQRKADAEWQAAFGGYADANHTRSGDVRTRQKIAQEGI